MNTFEYHTTEMKPTKKKIRNNCLWLFFVVARTAPKKRCQFFHHLFASVKWREEESERRDMALLLHWNWLKLQQRQHAFVINCRHWGCCYRIEDPKNQRLFITICWVAFGSFGGRRKQSNTAKQCAMRSLSPAARNHTMHLKSHTHINSEQTNQTKKKEII